MARADLFLLVMLLVMPATMAGQTPQPADTPRIDGARADDDTIEAGEADAEVPRRRLIRWNE